MKSVGGYEQARGRFTGSGADDRFVALQLNVISGTLMTYDGSEILRPPRHRFDQHRSSNTQTASARQEHLHRRAIFLNETNTHEWACHRSIKVWYHSEALQSAHARRQQAFATRLVRGKIAPLKDQNG
jgi:hypothetical protein